MLRKSFIAFRLGKLFVNSSAPYKKSNHVPFWVHQHICWLKLRQIYAGKVRLSSNRHVLADAAVYCWVVGATGVWFGGYPVCPLLYQQETFMLKAKTATCWFVSQLSLFLQGSEHSGSLLLCCRLRCDDLVVFTHFFAAMISTSTLAKLNWANYVGLLK